MKRKSKKTTTFKFNTAINVSQNPLIISPQSSARDKNNGFRRGLSRGATLISRKDKFDFDDEFRPYRIKLQKLYEDSFVKKLLNRTQIVNRMNTYQKQVLDDLQFGSDAIIDDIDTILYKFMTKYFNHYPTIQPQGKFKTIWNLILLFNIILTFLWVPYKLSFQYENIMQLLTSNFDNLWIEYIIITISIFDILLNFNLAYIFKGKIINQKYHIMKNYLTNSCSLDIICLLCLSYLLLEQMEIYQIQMLLCLIYLFLNSIKIYNIFHQILDYFNILQNDASTFFYNTLTLLYLMHLIACIWYSLIKDTQQVLDDKSIEIQYMYCLHWAAVYMTSVGQTQLQSNNNQQLAFSSFASLLSVLINAFITIKVALFVYNQAQKTQHWKQITSMNKFMNINNINYELQYRIRNYLDFIFKAENLMQNEDVSSITNKLSESLRTELKYQLQANILENTKILSNNFSKKFLKQLIYYMEEVKTSPEQRIITIDQIDDSSLYFVNKGEVNIIFEEINNMNERHQRNQIKTIQKGETFGIYGFITSLPRTASIISKGFCQLYKITRINFINLLEQFPDDKEIFSMIKDNLLLEQDFSKLNTKCYGCKSDQHLVNKCPFLHYQPDNDRVLKQQLYPIQQEREESIIPRKSKYINALLNIKVISEVAKQIMTDFDNIHQIKSENINESDHEDTVSNVQSKSLSKSFSQYSKSYRPSFTQQSNTVISSQEISKIELENIQKIEIQRISSQKETAEFKGGTNFGVHFTSQKHNPLTQNDQDVPVDVIDEDIQKLSNYKQHQKLSSLNCWASEKSPKLQRRISQKVSFEQTVVGGIKQNRRSSVMFDNSINNIYDENVPIIEFTIITQPSLGDFDKIYEFRKYFPQYNAKRVIKKLQQLIRIQSIPSKQLNSLYSFLYQAIIRGRNFRKNLLSRYRINTNSPKRKSYKKLKTKTLIIF